MHFSQQALETMPNIFGAYFVKLETDKDIVTEKFIKRIIMLCPLKNAKYGSKTTPNAEVKVCQIREFYVILHSKTN